MKCITIFKLTLISVFIVIILGCELDRGIVSEHHEGLHDDHVHADVTNLSNIVCIDEDKFKDQITIWNEHIRNELESREIELDPWNTEEDFIQKNIDKMLQALPDLSAENDFKTYVFMHHYLGINYDRLAVEAQRSGNSENTSWEKSIPYYKKVIKELRDRPSEKLLLGETYYAMASAYIRTGQLEEAMKLATILVEEFQDLDTGGPYPRWFAVRFGLSLFNGLNNLYRHDEHHDLKVPQALEAVAYLHEVADRYNNEVGFFAAKNLHKYYFLTKQKERAEDAYHQATYLLDQLDYEYIESRWERYIQNEKMVREFEQRGWKYAL